jgi:hypothetical protein
MDQRSRVARALHDRLQAIGADFGGLDELSALQRSLLERAVHVEGLIEQHEARIRQGGEFNPADYLALLDRLVRLSVTLGIERRAKPLQDLRTYLASKAAPAPSAAPAASTAVVEQAAGGTDQEEARDR